MALNGLLVPFAAGVPEIQNHRIRAEFLEPLEFLLMRFQKINGITNLIEQMGKIILADVCHKP